MVAVAVAVVAVTVVAVAVAVAPVAEAVAAVVAGRTDADGQHLLQQSCRPLILLEEQWTTINLYLFC